MEKVRQQEEIAMREEMKRKEEEEREMKEREEKRLQRYSIVLVNAIIMKYQYNIRIEKDQSRKRLGRLRSAIRQICDRQYRVCATIFHLDHIG